MSPRIIPLVLLASISSLAPALTGCSSGESTQPGVVSPIEQLKRLERTHVVVVISANNRVKLNGSRVSPEDLPGELASLGKKQPGRPVALVMQFGTNPDAETFVRTHATKAGLGPVEPTELH
jgi:hypothetical protein